MTAEEYDVVVVGAGPGGTSAGRFAAQGGARTLIIEKRQEIGVPVRCGEGIARIWLDEIGLEPFPGLSSFDEGDAEFFFGREAEVEAVWTKLQSAQFLGIIGASGSGKSSFIGAGLVPAKPEGWSIVRCTPGNAAVDTLRTSIVSEIEDDLEAVRSLADDTVPGQAPSASPRISSR